MGDGTGAAPGGGGAQVQVKKYVNYALLHLWRGEGWHCFCPEGRVFSTFHPRCRRQSFGVLRVKAKPISFSFILLVCFPLLHAVCCD